MHTIDGLRPQASRIGFAAALASSLILATAFATPPVRAAQDGKSGSGGGTGSTAPASSSDSDADQMTAERPGETNGTDTVTPGHYQLEAGYAYTQDRGGWEHRYLDTSQIRVPVNERFEARLGLPAYDSAHPNGMSGMLGWEDLSLSVKYRFLDAAPRRPSFALIAGTTLPSGAPGLRAGSAQPQLDLEGAYVLSSLWQLTANAAWTRADDGGGTPSYNQYAGAVNLGYSVSPSASIFGEAYRVAPTGSGGPSGDYADAGITYLVSKWTQLDSAAGVGVTSAVRGDHYFGAGISRRW